MTKFAVAILLAAARAESISTANQMLPGCKGFIDDSMTSVLMIDNWLTSRRFALATPSGEA